MENSQLRRKSSQAQPSLVRNLQLGMQKTNRVKESAGSTSILPASLSPTGNKAFVYLGRLRKTIANLEKYSTDGYIRTTRIDASALLWYSSRIQISWKFALLNWLQCYNLRLGNFNCTGQFTRNPRNNRPRQVLQSLSSLNLAEFTSCTTLAGIFACILSPCYTCDCSLAIVPRHLHITR